MTTIKLKNGSGAPADGDLVQGEPALDLTNKRLYTENASGTVIEVGTNPTSVTTGDITATGTATFAGLTTTADVSFGDNDKAIFGAGSDLQIYHDGSGSYIDDVGTGNLFVRADSLQLRRADGSQLYLAANTGAEVALYHAGNAKLATTSTGIDVTGKATADSFEVDATDDIRLRFLNASTFKGGLQIATTAGDMISGSAVDDLCIRGQSNILFATGGNTNRINIGSGGDISFYEDTGTTAKLVWKSADERLGIGTSSPATALEVNGTIGIGRTAGGYTFRETVGGGERASLKSNASNELLFNIGAASEAMRVDSSGNVQIKSAGKLQAFRSDNARSILVYTDNDASTVESDTDPLKIKSADRIQFETGGANERMRLDASGNLLIGKTAVGSTVDGFEARASGYTALSDTSGAALNVNRNTTDGNIVTFTKDGTTVGSIGTDLSRLFIGSDDSMIFFDAGSTNAIWPWKSTATSDGDADNTIDIGDSNNRFKNLYLSGQTLGATGTAGAPAYAFGNDTDMGMYRASNNNLAFSTNGGERMRIDGSGNLLVGTTTSPASGNAKAVKYGVGVQGGSLSSSVGATANTVTDIIDTAGVVSGTTGAGMYLVSMVRDGASYGTHFVGIFGVGSSVTLYETLQSSGVTVTVSGTVIRASFANTDTFMTNMIPLTIDN